MDLARHVSDVEGLGGSIRKNERLTAEMTVVHGGIHAQRVPVLSVTSGTDFACELSPEFCQRELNLLFVRQRFFLFISSRRLGWQNLPAAFRSPSSMNWELRRHGWNLPALIAARIAAVAFCVIGSPE